MWHTTGSGKTMTSFKAAQLVAANHDADKVVFLVDRKELGIQSLKEYRSFATGTESVQATENTDVLISKLKSPDSDNTLIVTSIQKLSNIAREDVANIEADLKIIQRKRMVIIIDECHRSTFGDMLVDIKNTFKNALIFGFTGTPIQDLNAKKDSTTPTIFGDAKYYTNTTQVQFDKHTLHSNNLYQIFTYVKNREYQFGDEDNKVSGMLLYARSDVLIQPDNVYQMHGNQISVKTLDLNKPFEEIAKQLDEIAAAHFDGIEKTR